MTYGRTPVLEDASHCKRVLISQKSRAGTLQPSEGSIMLR